VKWEAHFSLTIKLLLFKNQGNRSQLIGELSWVWRRSGNL